MRPASSPPATRRRRLIITGILGLSLLATGMYVRNSSAELTGPAQSDRDVAFAVSLLLEHDHLTKHPLDQEISRRSLKSFLKGLDPMKLYFTKEDAEEFDRFKDTLLVQVKKGDVSAAYTIFNRFLTRIDERLKLVDDILGKDLDFTVDEEMSTEADQSKYATDADDLRAKWVKRLKYDILVQKTDTKESKEPVDVKAKILRRYVNFGKRMQKMSRDDLLEMFLSSITTSLDPHTTYMSPSTLNQFEIQMRLNLDGIGASLQSEDGSTIVNRIVAGGAAEKDGRLKAQDKIIGVGQGENGDIVETEDMNLNDVVSLIRGKAGTIVRLKVVPVGKSAPEIYNITRARIELKDSEARSEVVQFGQKQNGNPFKIGWIDLPSFYLDMEGARLNKPEYKSTTRDMRKILEDFKQRDVDAVVLDLRRNGGGSLTEAIDLTGLFIDLGPVVQTKNAAGQVDQHKDVSPGESWTGPLVVLTSKFSASASEIFAAAIQDYHRGLIVGDHQTFGKGTVQTLYDLGKKLFSNVPNPPQMGALKITVQQFYRPGGDSTQERGVVVDVEIPSLTSHLDVGEKDMENHMKFDHVPAAAFKVVNSVDSTVVGELRTLSKARCDNSPDFDKVRHKIERYEVQKQKKSVTLNEKKFMDERADVSADKEIEEKEKELDDVNRPVVKKDYYFNEAINVTLDFLKLGKVAAK